MQAKQTQAQPEAKSNQATSRGSKNETKTKQRQKDKQTRTQAKPEAEAAKLVREGKVRTLKFAVEQLHGMKLPPNYPLLVWAVECAGQIESKTHRYTGVGRTAFETKNKQTQMQAKPEAEAAKLVREGQGRTRKFSVVRIFYGTGRCPLAIQWSWPVAVVDVREQAGGRW